MILKTLTTMLTVLLLASCSKSETTDTNSSTEQKVEKVEKEKATTQKENISKTETTTKIKPQESVKKSLLTIHTLQGKEIHIDEAPAGLTFKEHKDKMVFVIFFGYRCPPCLHELPHLIALMEKKHPDLEIIAIEAQGLNKEELIAYKNKKGINYTLAVGRENNQFINYIATKAQWSGSIPFFIAFDKKGEVKIVHVGALNSTQLNNIYSELK